MKPIIGRDITRPEVQTDGERYIVAAPGRYTPNWVDFAGPVGLVNAYKYTRRRISGLRRSIRWMRPVAVKYCLVELKSHQTILSILEQIAAERGIILPYRSDPVAYPGSWHFTSDLRSHCYAAGSMTSKFSELPQIDDPLLYAPDGW